MLCDEVKVFVEGGKGGDGVSSFRREIYVPKGGPDGGDGGRGGHVILRASNDVQTLLSFRYQPHIKAEKGKHGKGKNQHGRAGQDLILDVPPGLVVLDEEGEKQLAELLRPGQKAVIARGGRGGRGNARFATSRRKAPTMAEKGEPGEKRTVLLVLKLVADVGLIGLPNAGKSTLLASISAAKPKVGSYPFTTLEPQLGLVKVGDEHSFVAADLPGLIKDAHKGKGLGYRFLRHAERTSVFIHVVDIAATQGQDPYDDFTSLCRELTLYKRELAERPMVVAANKIDLPGSDDNLKIFKEKLQDEMPVFPISAATGEGKKDLLYHISRLVREASYGYDEEDEDTIIYLEPETEELFVEKKGDCFVVKGREVERLAAMTDWHNEDATRRFQKNFVRIGGEKLLQEKGVSPGDTVVIGEKEFVYQESWSEEDRDK